jgi:predicted Rossmann-fold nucleotide-binding protein
MIVGVMASGDEELAKNHAALAEEVGSTVAELGFDLLTGGGGGLMKAVGQAFLDKKRELLKTKKPTGNLISILRANKPTRLNNKGKREWQPHADNGLGEIVIRTHLPLSGNEGRDPLSRNHINALTSDLVVVLPGGDGTLSELQLAWEYGKKIIIYLGKGQVGGKMSQELEKEFSGVKVAETKQDFEDRIRKQAV